MVNTIDQQPDKRELAMQKGSKLKLSAREERLLVSYYDGECGHVREGRARRLLSRSLAARQFIQALRAISAEIRSFDDENSPHIDLWGRISARIEAEEHAQLHATSASAHGLFPAGWRALEWRPRVTWGAGGAAVASLCSVMLIQFGLVGNSTLGSARSSTGNFNSAVNQPPLVSEVSYSEDEPRGSSNPMEVDWMRSAGRVKLLEDPSEKSPIIWVKPPNSTSSQVAFSSDYYSNAANSRKLGRSNTHIPVAIPASGLRR